MYLQITCISVTFPQVTDEAFQTGYAAKYSKTHTTGAVETEAVCDSAIERQLCIWATLDCVLDTAQSTVVGGGGGFQWRNVGFTITLGFVWKLAPKPEYTCWIHLYCLCVCGFLCVLDNCVESKYKRGVIVFELVPGWESLERNTCSGTTEENCPRDKKRKKEKRLLRWGGCTQCTNVQIWLKFQTSWDYHTVILTVLLHFTTVRCKGCMFGVSAHLPQRIHLFSSQDAGQD